MEEFAPVSNNLFSDEDEKYLYWVDGQRKVATQSELVKDKTIKKFYRLMSVSLFDKINQK